ncbi:MULTISPECIES: ABC transporter permease [Brevibacillus]|uniref:ABC transporter permease n=1 Tax=Brevibacillus parabrevis TaxID=54914 RepID=A0A4Y3PAL3_BREPA|nr:MULTISPECIES: ABC transporter permease [Brevibacillus]MBU8712640.1 ABC transporter permease [Brevibacillus parabrevis]MDR5000264.1 ABC transporter permease [Brevibacillus parabrevis]MED1722209.1 ABC transporter permease [Brevibacillus parabrevis]NRQ52665.1 ABC transporter permease [Brevibacillus sp. HD1.4A]RNB96507.1 ABC transporter permease [Brevibacillus parabrevis]
MHINLIAKREVKVGFRNPWAYSFMALFSLFSLGLLVIQSQSYMKGYTYTTGTMLNLILYLLPLMTMLLSSFSLTAEKEEGSWQLLSTYAMTTSSFLIGKYVGQALVLIAIVSFGYGISGVAGLLLGKSFAFSTLLFLLVFSICLILLFLGIAMLIGALCRNRWQALTMGVSIWFFYILAWPTLLISLLSFVPYTWIKPLLQIVTFFNPAEFVRVYSVTRLGGGAIFGPEYYKWIYWIDSALGDVCFVALCLLWISATLFIATRAWERR